MANFSCEPTPRNYRVSGVKFGNASCLMDVKHTSSNVDVLGASEFHS